MDPRTLNFTASPVPATTGVAEVPPQAIVRPRDPPPYHCQGTVSKEPSRRSQAFQMSSPLPISEVLALVHLRLPPPPSPIQLLRSPEPSARQKHTLEGLTDGLSACSEIPSTLRTTEAGAIQKLRLARPTSSRQRKRRSSSKRSPLRYLALSGQHHLAPNEVLVPLRGRRNPIGVVVNLEINRWVG